MISHRNNFVRNTFVNINILSKFKLIIVFVILTVSFQSINIFADEKVELVKEIQIKGTILEGKPNVPEEKVIAVVKQVFTNAGLNLKENVPYKKDNISCKLDLYDETKKVGFVYICAADKESRKAPAEEGFSKEEIKLIKTTSDNIFSIYYSDKPFHARQRGKAAVNKVLLEVEKAAKQYIEELRKKGVL